MLIIGNEGLFNSIEVREIVCQRREYPRELEHSEWIKKQNYFLQEQNKNLRKKLFESEEYINSLLDRLKLYQNK